MCEITKAIMRVFCLMLESSAHFTPFGYHPLATDKYFRQIGLFRQARFTTKQATKTGEKI